MIKLTINELAELAGCGLTTIKRMIYDDKLTYECVINSKGRKKYLFPLESLPEDIRARYYRSKFARPSILRVSDEALENFTESEREEIKRWYDIIAEWLRFRDASDSKAEADAMFIEGYKEQHGPYSQMCIAGLYKRWRCIKEGNISGLVDKRGGYNKGVSSIPQEVWDRFMFYYLNENRPSVNKCYLNTVANIEETLPQLVNMIPSQSAFRRRLAEVPKAVLIAGREGNKAMLDKAAPYISRDYHSLSPNDIWIADNHTLDIISYDEEKEMKHRLYLTAFLDARSGVLVGWNITENPNSQSTLIALRHGIMRFGIPKKVYFDNGSEFLTHDLAGRGHRTRKSQINEVVAHPVFARLGIEMINAIVKNAKAKPIERVFRTIKEDFSKSFITFCGGNVLEKPERLKSVLKSGEIPTDSTVSTAFADYADGIYNVGSYTGAVQADRKMSRVEVWNSYIKEQRKAINEDDLNLMLMRSTRAQTVGRNGVHLTIAGERLDYWNEETWKMQGEKVYLRYDPSDLGTVRVYNAESDKYIATLPLSQETRIKFDAEHEDVALAQAKVHEVGRAIRKNLKDYKERLEPCARIDMLDMELRRAHKGKQKFVIQEPKVIIPVVSGEQREEPLKAVAGDVMPVIIDINKMNRNAEARRK